MYRATLLLACLLASLFTYACVPTPSPSSQSDMERQTIAIRRLTSAIEGEHWLESDPSVSGAELLRRACEKDKALCEPFAKSLVQVRRTEQTSHVLVCTSNGTTALLEDLACTPEPDRKAWTEKQACEFTLDPARLCP